MLFSAKILNIYDMLCNEIEMKTQDLSGAVG